MAVEVRPTTLNVESSLDEFADIFSMSLVEQDTGAKTTPTAEKWEDINKGDELVVKFGLDGGELLDFGTFIVDQAGVRGSPSGLVQRLRGRDEAGLLVDGRGAQYWGPSSGGNQGTFTWENPKASTIAGALAVLVGLELSWNGPDWQVREFTLAPHETLSEALDRLLQPVQAIRRYAMDAWVRDGVLSVRQRGAGEVRATVDVRTCESWSVDREYVPPIGDVTCNGAKYRVPTGLALDSSRAWSTEDGEESDVSEEWLGDEDGMTVTTERKIWTKEGGEDGVRILASIQTAVREYRQVTPGTGTAGKLLVKVTTRTQTNLNKTADQRHESVVEQKFGYQATGNEWFRTMEQTITSRRKAGESDLIPKTKKIVVESQVTPSEIERTTVNFKIAADGGETIPGGSPPEVEQEPGTLQSVLRVEQAPSDEDDWGFDVAGLTEVFRYQFEDEEYSGTATGDVAEEAQIIGLGEVGTDDFCETIAGLIVAEHDVWRYDIGLRFANEVRYQKGDKLTLTNIPGFTGSLAAVITDVTVDLDETRYSFDMRLQGWVAA